MDIPRKELELGIKDETGEHGMSKKQAAKTAIDHLKKNKNYYSKLKSIGLEEMQNVEEDFDTSINVEGGSIDINDDAVLDAVNRKLAGLTTKSCITPYIKLQKIRELLAYYNIFLPQTVFLEGDDGNEVFEISQFGEKIGMDNQGVVKKKNSDGLYLYFEWVTNEGGMIDVFAEIVDKEDLEELLSDFEDEYDDGDDDVDADGAEASFDTYKAGNMNEETVNEDDMDLFDDDDKPKKKKKKAKAFVHKTSGKEIKSVGKTPSKDWKKVEEDYDDASAEAANYAKAQVKRYTKLKKSTYDKRERKEFGREIRAHKKYHKYYDKKATTGLDEEKKKHTRVVTASKKAEKGTKWKVQARNPDSEGSEVELRQGKRVKMKGYFDRNANDFTMDPTKKNKIDWKANKTQSFNSGKDILKTVKESTDEEKRQKRLQRWVPKTKKKKLGKNAELVAGWKDEIKQVRASMKKRLKEERLDELSDNTHMSYRAKARNQIMAITKRLGSKTGSSTVNTKKLKNRADGIKKSYKLQPKEKLKEANEPFEGPYVQKGKEKSNPDRRASTIAHKALKAVKKKMRKGETEKQWRKRMQDRYETLEFKGD
jgi:hypothetical protein